MATRLYLHNATYNRSFFGGKYNQGAPSYVEYAGAYGNGRHVVVGNALNYSTVLYAVSPPIDWNTATTVNTQSVYGVWYSTTLSLWAYCDVIGRIYTSPDGDTWTLRYTDAGALSGNNMYYANGYFLSCHATGVMVYSTNGTTWARVTTTNAGTADINMAAYSPTLNRYIYCGGGTNGTIAYTSTPATTWTTTTQTVAGINYSCTWSSSLNLFLVTGQNGKILTSPTGLTGTWTQQTTGTTNSIWAIAGNTDGSVLLAAGTGVMLKSTNGTAWSNITANLPDPVNTTYSIWHDGTDFYVTGGISQIFKSTDDGTTWTVVGGDLSTAVITSAASGVFVPNMDLLKTMNTTLGAAQVTVSCTTADVATTQSQLMSIFASQPLASNQTVGGGTMILNTAQNASSAAAAFQMNAINVYVWRPSTSTVVGYIRDAGGTQLANNPGGTGETVTNITGITTTAIAAKRGDIIVCEMWSRFTQSMGTAYTVNFYYDGTTANTTQGASVTNHASFVEFTENLTFSATPVLPPKPFVIVITS